MESPETPCMCLPLHRFCNPERCPTLAQPGHQAIRPALRRDALAFEWAVETTVKELETEAERPCQTCIVVLLGLALFEPDNLHADTLVKVSFDGLVQHLDRYDVFHPIDFSIPRDSGEHHLILPQHDPQTHQLKDGEPACHAFPVTEGSTHSTRSDASFDSIKTWMAQCESHPLCQSGELSLLPMRILDLTSEDPVLIEPSGVRAPYLALSYCWGGSLVAKTTTATRPVHMQKIPLSGLPNTFRDAIYITKRLGFSYLWIDALCIIQDDDADWQSESAKMAEIYERAILTLSADASSNAEGGCFQEINYVDGREGGEITKSRDNGDSSGHLKSELSEVKPETSVASTGLPTVNLESRATVNPQSKHNEPPEAPQDRGNIASATKLSPGERQDGVAASDFGTIVDDLPDDGNGSRRVQEKVVLARFRPALDHAHFSGNRYQSHPFVPLSTRAWALQERLLSTRVVHFGESELTWECKTVAACQCGRLNSLSPFSLDPGEKTLKVWFEQQFQNTPQEVAEIRELWRGLIFQYSSRCLSHERDRLPAFSGLATKFGRHPSLGAYRAGLWEGDLGEQLLWWAAENSPQVNRASRYVAPTWSWASVKGGVYTTPKTFKWFGASQRKAAPFLDVVGQVVDVQTTAAGPDPTGAVLDGRLTVCTAVIEGVLLRELDRRPETGDDEPATRYLIAGPDGIAVPFYPDSLGDIHAMRGEESVICAQWTRRPGPKTLAEWAGESFAVVSYFLVLRPSERLAGAFERIGLLELWEYSEDRPAGQGWEIPVKEAPSLDNWMEASAMRTMVIV